MSKVLGLIKETLLRFFFYLPLKVFAAVVLFNNQNGPCYLLLLISVELVGFEGPLLSAKSYLTSLRGQMGPFMVTNCPRLPGLRDFSGCGTFSAKMRSVLDKLE